MGGRGSASSTSTTYTSGDYTTALREWTQGDYNSMKSSSVLESFIREYKDTNPVTNPIARGVSMSDAEVAALQEGQTYTFEGITSWSSKIGIAQSFARGNTNEVKPNRVVFRRKNGSDRAAKIGTLVKSKYAENESLMLPKTKYKIDKVKRVSSIAGWVTEVWLK